MKAQELLFIIRARNAARAVLNQFGGQLGRMAKSARQASDGLRKSGKDTRKMGREARAARDQVSRLRLAMTGLGRTSLRRPVRDIQRLGDVSKIAQGATSRLLNIITRFGPAFAAGFAFTAAIQDASRAFLSTERNLAQIVGLVGVAADQVKGFESELERLSTTFGRSTSELSQGLFFVTSAGFRGAEAIDVLEASTEAAVAGLGEIEVVANAVTSVVTAYGSETLSASQATDILAATVRAGKFTVDEFAGGVGRLLGTAAELGFRFEDIGAAVALMTKRTGDATLAIVGIGGIMNQLNRASTEGAKALDNVGLSFTELRRILREEGLLRLVQVLRENFQGQTETLRDIFQDSQALNAILILMGATNEELAETFGAVANSAGVARGAYEAVAQTVDQRLAVAQEKISVQLQRLAADILPTVASALEGLADSLQFIFALVTNLAIAFAGLTLAKFIATVARAVRILGVAGAAVLFLNKALKGLAAALAFLRISPLVAAITGLVAIVTLFTRRIGEAEEALDAARQSAEETADVMKELGDVTAESSGRAIAAIQKRIEAEELLLETLRDNLVAQLDILALQGISLPFLELRGQFFLEDAVQNIFDFVTGNDQVKAEISEVDKRLAALRVRLKEFQRLNREAVAGPRAEDEGPTPAAPGLEESEISKLENALRQLRSRFLPVIDAQKDLLEIQKTLNEARQLGAERLKALGVTEEDFAVILQRAREEFERRLDVVGETIRKIDEEIRVIGLSGSAREEELAVIRAQNEAKKLFIDLSEEEIQRIRERVRLREQEEFRVTAARRLEDLRDELFLTQQLESERDRFNVALRESKSALEAGFSVQEAQRFAREAVAAFDDVRRASLEMRRDFDFAVQEGFRQFTEQALDTTSQVAGFIDTTFGALEDAVVEFTQTGKFNITDLVNTINAELTRVATRRLFGRLTEQLFPTEQATPGEVAEQATTRAAEAAQRVADTQVQLTAASVRTASAAESMSGSLSQIQLALQQLNSTLATGGGFPPIPGRRPDVAPTIGVDTAPIVELNRDTQDTLRQASREQARVYGDFVDEQERVTADFSDDFGGVLGRLVDTLFSSVQSVLPSATSDILGGGTTGGFFGSLAGGIGDIFGGLFQHGGSVSREGLPFKELFAALSSLRRDQRVVVAEVGEVILNRQQQTDLAELAEVLRGAPRFQTGGVVGTRLTNRRVLAPSELRSNIAVAPQGRMVDPQQMPNKVVNVNVRMQVVTSDASSFGRDRSQIERRLGRGIRASIARDD